MALRIVTDSTCDLPHDIVRSLDITVVPCNVHFGEQVYRDGVDLTRAEFYRRLSSGGAHPTTSQPSAGAFLEVYRKMARPGDEVLSVHVSSKLSGTCHSARMAREEARGTPAVEVVDSQQVSLGLGILVMETARMAHEGASLAQAKDFLEREIPKVTCYCTVDTLEYLVRGGRASRLQGFFGTLLNIKPIIAVKDGEVHPVSRVRSRRRAVERFVELAASARALRAVGVVHGAAPDVGGTLAEGCGAHFPRERIVVSEFSAVMGVHLGPGALGLGLWVA